MPTINPNLDPDHNNNNAATAAVAKNGTSTTTNLQRTTFRPPWVRDEANSLPMPSTPWTPRVRGNANSPQTSTVTPTPTQTPYAFEKRYQEKVIPFKVTAESAIEVAAPAANTNRNISSQSTPTPPTISWRKERPQASAESNVGINQKLANAERTVPLSVKSPMPMPMPMPLATQGPPPPPPPPPPIIAKTAQPPPPSLLPSSINSGAQQQPSCDTDVASGGCHLCKMLEKYNFHGQKRNLIDHDNGDGDGDDDENNDDTATTFQNVTFVYDSEKKEDDSHNKLLKQIQTGVRLRKVKCNDRSRPNLDGLRKFRRQMTIEEQIQKSVSMADVVAAAVEPDELDDIDKVRDDLQSAKQMLALELRNKEAMERENKRLIARLANLEAELEKEKASRKSEIQEDQQPIRTDEDEKLIVKLKEDAAEADRIAKDMEQKYHTTAEQLDNTRRKLESAWLRNQELELQLKSMSQGNPTNQLMKQPSKKFIPIANGGSVDLISDDDEDSETESEEESENESAATQERQVARELKLLTTKLKTFREKQAASLKERRILRDQLKKKQKELKVEKKKYKLLHKEVEKMAKLMKETEEGDEEYEEEVPEDEEQSETESESESESDSEEESDEEVPHNAIVETKRKILLERTKKHENRLSSLKKGNNLMRANIERLQDDVNKQREMSLTLQEDLNNILADLG